MDLHSSVGERGGGGGCALKTSKTQGDCVSYDMGTEISE
jgi:hypothetical protein